MATFHQLATLVNINHRGGDMPRIARVAHECGFRGVVVSTHQGLKEADIGGAPVPVDYTKMLKAAGLRIAVMGWITRCQTKEEAQAQAQVAARMVEKHQAEVYFANGEQPLQYSQHDGACVPCFSTSQWFVERLRQITGVDVCLTTFAHCRYHDIHYAPWLNSVNARIAPQAYSNMFGPAYRAKETFATAIDVGQPHNEMFHPVTKKRIPGFPLSYWHPMLGNWGSSEYAEFSSVEKGARRNVMELIEAKLNWEYFWGWSVYTMEHQTEASLRIYEEAIRTYDTAKL